MKLASLILLLALAGCTVRGGWPRFLRPGEASAIPTEWPETAFDDAKRWQETHKYA